MAYTIRLKGGPGSGFHGHKGRPGFVGGSSPEGSSASGSQAPDESGLDPYSKELIAIGKKAIALGIKSFTDRRIVKDIARGAAELINSRTKVGYTVYGSDTSHLSEDGTHDLGSFPMVAYGAETPKQVQGMINYLKGFGYKAMLGPEKYGILVTPPDTKSLEDYWTGQKEFIGKSYVMRLKGGPGSGHHGHRGIPGHHGGSLPAGGQASGRKTTKLNRREVHSPDDKPGDLPGIRSRIPNEDGELSRGSAHEAYANMFRDDTSNVTENMKILHNRRIASGEYDTTGQESQAQDAYEQVLDDITNQMYDIADKMRKRGLTPSVRLLIRDYQKINNMRFNKQEREDLSSMLSQGSYQLGNPILD
ncbi:MAG: hypothetical protein WC479_00590 [Candidatus Izemoplasmatales bacterium]